MKIFKDRWEINKGNRTSKARVLQILFHPGDGMTGLNPSFINKASLKILGGKRTEVHPGTRIRKPYIPTRENSSFAYTHALFSFKNIKSKEAAIRIIEKRNISRIFQAYWTEMIGGKLKRHLLVKGGKLKIN